MPRIVESIYNTAPNTRNRNLRSEATRARSSTAKHSLKI
jgi:hypothetical protein